MNFVDFITSLSFPSLDSTNADRVSSSSSYTHSLLLKSPSHHRRNQRFDPVTITHPNQTHKLVRATINRTWSIDALPHEQSPTRVSPITRRDLPFRDASGSQCVQPWRRICQPLVVIAASIIATCPIRSERNNRCYLRSTKTCYLLSSIRQLPPSGQLHQTEMSISIAR